jgi:hypothetical protein
MFISYFKEGCKVVQDMGQIDNILDYWGDEFSSITETALLAGSTSFSISKVRRLFFHLKPLFFH